MFTHVRWQLCDSVWLLTLHSCDSVATNLEYSEYSWDFSNKGFSVSGKLREFCGTSWKNCNEQNSVTECSYWCAKIL